MVATAVEWAARAPVLAAMSVPLETISGIAERRRGVLAGMGLDSIPRLAAADPDIIEAELVGVSPSMAGGFVSDAKDIMANVTALPAPLVSCVMPTFNRRPFIAQSIEYFNRQDYPNRELIILDDGTDPVADLVPDENRIRYIRLENRMTVGAKRNLGGELARGPIIVCWDDDCWYRSTRLSYQAAAMIEFGADVCGLDNQLHFNPITGKAYHSVRPSGPLPWMPGNTLCYTKSFWQTNRFPDMQPGADIRFLRQKPTAKIVPLQAVDWLVDIIHRTNVSPKPITSPLWFDYKFAKLQELLGNDMNFYMELAASEFA
jgi:glycosyltransferase involved in cell wall biosynthesis